MEQWFSSCVWRPRGRFFKNKKPTSGHTQYQLTRDLQGWGPERGVCGDYDVQPGLRTMLQNHISGSLPWKGHPVHRDSGRLQEGEKKGKSQKGMVIWWDQQAHPGMHLHHMPQFEAPSNLEVPPLVSVRGIAVVPIYLWLNSPTGKVSSLSEEKGRSLAWEPSGSWGKPPVLLK